jgi:hypothetical protein
VTEHAWGRWTSGQRALPSAPKPPPAWLTRARVLSTVDKSEDTEDKSLDPSDVTFKATDPRGIEWKGQKAGTTLEIGDGMVVAIFNVTNIKDRVDDRTLPGCYRATLEERTPKAIRAHDWARFVGTVSPIAELMPGDSRLPDKLADGSPWPKDAGGLVGQVHYNLDTQLGRDAFADAKFLGPDQEWCADAETEILTEFGWRRYDQLIKGMMVYTCDPVTGVGRFEPLEKINVFPAALRRMRLIETGGFSSLTTGAHRWPVRFDDGRTGWRTTEQLVTSNAILRAAARSDALDAKWSDAFVETVAWYWTEGWVNQSNVYIQQAAVNADHTARIRAALNAAFPGQIGEVTRPDGASRFRIDYQASAALQAVCGHAKEPRADFLMQLTVSQLRLLIDRAIDADGTRTTRQTIWYQVRDEGVAAFQMACALAGIPTVASQPKDYGNRYGKVPQRVALLRSMHAKPLAAIHVRKYNSKPRRVEHRDDWVDHDGPVWCPTTQSGTWLARRRGTVYFTGNSIGYKALKATRDRAGIRNIAVLDLYEVSDVLWGAMTWARTLAVGGSGAA